MNNNLKPSEKVCSPFMYYCQKVIPLAFDESMSYYEQLCNLVYYLKNTVMPAVNNNADALTEVQNAFKQLEKYVDDYFKNLDVQTEINNKLDEMAESGQLAEIIALYIQSSAVLGYKTVDDMKNATNLVDGSICKTISNTTVGDNGGRFYLVRTITSSDVVDEVNIISLSVSDTLIAQLINDDRFTNLIGDLNDLTTTDKSNLVNAINSLKEETDESIEDISNEINTQLPLKENKLTEIVIFGDSWSDPTSLDAIWGTQDYIGKELNLNVNNFALSGAKMSGTDNTSLQAQVQTFNSSNVNKTKVKYIVILGGINDFRNSITWTNLRLKIEEQIEILKGYCPQAKILFVSNCQWYYSKEQGDYWCGVHEDIRAVNKIVTYNMFGTFGKEMYNTNNYFHLTQTGQKMMMSNIIASLTGGELIYWEDSVDVTNSDGHIKYSTQRIKNMVILDIEFTPTTSKSYYSFGNPSGYYFNYYEYRFGFVGRAKEVGICNINYNAISFDFSTNPQANEKYHFTQTLTLNHL